MQMMKEGAKWELYIKSELAYGDRGAGGKCRSKILDTPGNDCWRRRRRQTFLVSLSLLFVAALIPPGSVLIFEMGT